MKNILFIVPILFSLATSSLAQMGEYNPLYTDSRILIVGDISTYQISYLKKALDKHWNFGKLQVVSPDKVNEFKNDKSISYITISREFRSESITEKYYPQTNAMHPNHVERNYQMGFNGYLLRIGTRLNKSNEIITFYAPYVCFEYGKGDSLTYFAGVIRSSIFLRDYLNAFKTKKINKGRDYDEYLNKLSYNIDSLKNKTILIMKSDIDSTELNAITNYLPGKIKIATQAEINNATINYDPNVIYFCRVGYLGSTLNYFVRASDGQVLYCDSKVNNGRKLTLKEFKLLFREKKRNINSKDSN